LTVLRWVWSAAGDIELGPRRQPKEQRGPLQGFFCEFRVAHDEDQKDNSKGVVSMATGHERTKEQLYTQAKALGIKGRSKMNKGQLKAAIDRRR
jgi:hypothetical protein